MQKQRPFILILLALLQPLSGALSPLAGIGTPIGNATRDLGAPEQPLPVFFSIWSVIFAAYLLRREPWMDRIAMPLAIAGLMNVVWMLSAQLIVSQPLDFALLFPIGAAAWASAWQFDRVRGMGGSLAKLTADMATGLLSGWITVAVAISVPLAIRHFTDLGATDLPWLMLWTTLVTASLATWAFTRFISRSPWFFVSLGWGLLGIILNNWTITDMNWLAIMTGVVAVIVLYPRLTRGAHGAVQAA